MHYNGTPEKSWFCMFCFVRVIGPILLIRNRLIVCSSPIDILYHRNLSNGYFFVNWVTSSCHALFFFTDEKALELMPCLWIHLENPLDLGQAAAGPVRREVTHLVRWLIHWFIWRISAVQQSRMHLYEMKAMKFYNGNAMQVAIRLPSGKIIVVTSNLLYASVGGNMRWHLKKQPRFQTSDEFKTKLAFFHHLYRNLIYDPIHKTSHLSCR